MFETFGTDLSNTSRKVLAKRSNMYRSYKVVKKGKNVGKQDLSKTNQNRISGNNYSALSLMGRDPHFWGEDGDRDQLFLFQLKSL